MNSFVNVYILSYAQIYMSQTEVSNLCIQLGIMPKYVIDTMGQRITAVGQLWDE